MSAVQLIHKAKKPFELIIFNYGNEISKGIAYNSYSDKHLLNVKTRRMSAFPDQPDHFLNWVMKRDEFKLHDSALIGNSFLQRNLYGEYLREIWNDALIIAKTKGIKIHEIDEEVVDLTLKDEKVELLLSKSAPELVDHCIIATGNQLPRNPKINDQNFLKSENYFQNPWTSFSVKNTKSTLPVLIIGNGLTMVDTVLGLIEQGFKGEIVSVSPNGFNILPHRHSGEEYTKLTDELFEKISLNELVSLVNKHIKLVRAYGVSSESVIDSLRPYTQRIWGNLSNKEKELFMSRFRHLWGVARHRLPMSTHDHIQQLRIDGKLLIKSGRIIDIKEINEKILVSFLDKKSGDQKTIEVSRVINCTGPETDIDKMDHYFLKNCISKGIIIQDDLKLGIKTNVTNFKVFNKDQKEQDAIYTLGSNLKGELWESTAVNEIRGQAEQLATVILNEI